MLISKTTFTILLVSIFVGLFIMLFAFLITRRKIKTFQKVVVTKQLASGNVKKVFNRKNAGELLWSLREKTLNPLQDSQLEFLINTALRSDFRTGIVIGSNSNYEMQSLTKIASLKATTNNPDLVVMFSDIALDEFDNAYKRLASKQMIAITNAKQKSKKTKMLLRQLKDACIKHDYIFVGDGIILVVK